MTCDPTGTDLSLVAHDISWNQYCLAVPANTPFTVSIDNQDQGIDHNFSIYDSFFEETTYFKAPKITGVSSETVDVQGLPPGHYYFQCDVHGPAMSGAFIVAPSHELGGSAMAITEIPDRPAGSRARAWVEVVADHDGPQEDRDPLPDQQLRVLRRSPACSRC